MSSIWNQIKAIWSSSEANALFAEGMSSEAKGRIQSAIEAIDSSRREEVVNRTRQILLANHGVRRREKIISAVAAMRLSSVEWSNIPRSVGDIAYGLRKGEDFVKILRAIAALPPATRSAISAGAQRLVGNRMTIEQRLRVLDAVAQLRPEERDSVSTCARRLIYNRMTVEQRLRVLDAVAHLPSEERYSICTGAQGLVGNRMTIEQRLRVLDAVAQLRPEERDSVSTCARRLIYNRMTVEQRLRVLDAVAHLPSEERYSICTGAQGLICNRMTVEEIVHVLDAVRNVPLEERYSISDGAQALIREEMIVGERLHILGVVARLPSEERYLISFDTQRLIRNEMTVEERLRILTAVAGIPSQLRDWIEVEIANPEDLSVDEIVGHLQAVLARGGDLDWRYLEVDIDKLDENSTEVLEELIDRFDAERSFPRIRYRMGEVVDDLGVDVAGMSRGVVSELMRALCYPKPPNQRKLPMMVTERGFLPKMEDPRELKSYQSIGMLFAAALNGTRGILIGNHFNPTVFQMIHALTKEEIDQIPEDLSRLDDVPEEIRNKLLKPYLKSELPLAFGGRDMPERDLEAAIDNFVDRDLRNNWMSEFILINPGITKKNFLSERGIDQILLATFVIAKSMQQRIGQPSRWDLIKGRTAAELQKRIAGPALTKQSVIAALDFSEPDDERKRFLEQWIDRASAKELENFVFCISNLTTLRQGQPLTVKLQPASLNLPVFRTCFFEMKLPRYATYEVFRDKLNLSIQHIIEGNRIGLS